MLSDTPEELRTHDRVHDLRRAFLALKVAVGEVVDRLDKEADHI